MDRNPPMFTELFYLDKNLNGKNVFIPEVYAKKLTHTQRDGIRFLYRVFKKKDTGAIVNDPSDLDSTVQVILFLNSLKNILNNFSCLILCGSPEDWKQHIETWSEDCSDVIFEADNQFAKKAIFVDSVDNISKYYRRHWSVVVAHIDCEDGKIFKQLSLLKVNYKVCITKENLQKNFNSLATIYKWINPHGQFDKSDFTADPKDAVDVRKKRVLLDYFLSDILIRRDHKEPQINTKNYIANRTDSTKISHKMLKNKDPSGTKVKCSKKRKLEMLQTGLIDNVDVGPSNSENKLGDSVKDLDEAMDVGGGVDIDLTADTSGNIDFQSEIHSDKEAKKSDATIIDKDKIKVYDDVEKFISEQKPVECDWSDYIEQEIISKKPDESKKKILIDNILSEYF